MMHLYPNNKTIANSEQDKLYLAKWNTMSGEINHEIWIDCYGYMWYNTDWIGDKPKQISMHRATEITGDSEHMIFGRYKSFFRNIIDTTLLEE